LKGGKGEGRKSPAFLANIPQRKKGGDHRLSLFAKNGEMNRDGERLKEKEGAF